MKKTFCLGLILALVLSASCGLASFATEAKTNCIGGETSGPNATNCGDIEESEDIAPPALTVDEGEITFGKITELGRRYSKSITIRNNTSEKVTVRVEALAYEDADTEHSALDWVAFAGGKRKFDIKANGKLQLVIRLMVPSEVSGGTYYAKIKVSNGDEADDKFVTVRADVVTEEYKYGGEITNQYVGFINLGDKVVASASLKNTGTAGFTAKYLVSYKNAFGLPEWKDLKEEYVNVLPGKEVSFSVEDKEAIGYGIFTVEQKISYINADGQAKEAILSHAVVNLPWWSLAIAGGVILLIIVIVIIVKSRRKKAEKTEKAEKAKKNKKKSVTIKVEEDE